MPGVQWLPSGGQDRGPGALVIEDPLATGCLTYIEVRKQTLDGQVALFNDCELQNAATLPPSASDAAMRLMSTSSRENPMFSIPKPTTPCDTENVP